MGNVLNVFMISLKKIIGEMMKNKYDIKLILGWFFSYLITYGLIISESGTCTQGSFDEYSLGIIIASISVIVLLATLIIAKKPWGIPVLILVPHIITLILFFNIIPRYLINTTINGIALCQGNQEWGGFNNKFGFDKLPIADSFFEYLFAPILIVICLILVISLIFTIVSLIKRNVINKSKMSSSS